MDFGARDSIPTLFHHIGFSLKFGGIAIFFDLCFTAVTTRKQRFEYTEEVHKMGDSVRYPVMKSVKDAAGIYNLSPAYIRRLCRTGKVRFVNAGHRWLVNMDSLCKYFEAGDPGSVGQDEVVGGIRRVAR